MSQIKTIMDTVKTELGDISGVGLVTDDPVRWNGSQEDEYNRLYVSPRTTESLWISFPHATGTDKEYIVELAVDGVVKSRYPTDIDYDVDTLATNVEDALYNNAAIQALLDNATLTGRETSTDITDGYGLFALTFELIYAANHNSP